MKTPAKCRGFHFHTRSTRATSNLQDDELTAAVGAAAAAELSSPDEVPEMCRIATPPSAIVRTVTRATMILSRVDMIELPDSIIAFSRPAPCN
jgi:hypothetical protein